MEITEKEKMMWWSRTITNLGLVSVAIGVIMGQGFMNSFDGLFYIFLGIVGIAIGRIIIKWW